MSRDKRKLLTDLSIQRMKPPKSGQLMVWDSAQNGLALFIGQGGTKSFRSHFKLHDRYVSRSIGRFDAIMSDSRIAWARERCREDRKLAANGVDPRTHMQASDLTFAFVLDQFVELHCKPRQRTAQQTERLLKANCATWMQKPIDTITTQDAYRLLDKFIRDGHGPKAQLCLAWLRTLWSFASKRKLVKDPSIMRDVELNFERRVRDRVFTNDEIASIWNASEQLDDVFECYTKLALLLAPRKTALAKMRWTDLDNPDAPTLWTTPFELTKSRKGSRPRTYQTPLPRMAVELFKRVPRRHDELVFPSSRKSDVAIHPGSTLRRQLVKHGAPPCFMFHAMRHTIATHLETKGYSPYERALVLNHAGTGGATMNYSHGFAYDLKLKLLEEWAAHVEGLVSP